jgi:Sterol carrier protein domain
MTNARRTRAASFSSSRTAAAVSSAAVAVTFAGVGALASLYSGWSSSALLARAGLLAGGSAADRAALDAAFAGPAPWLLDEF